MMSFCTLFQELLIVKGRDGRDKDFVQDFRYEDADWIYWSQQGPEVVPYEQGYELLRFIKCWVY